MRVLMVRASVVALFIIAAPALSAQREGDDCTAEDLDRRIAGCTRILQDQGEALRNRVGAFINRAIAYKAKGDLDRAIADYNEAIRLDPKYADAYYNRAIAYKAKGNLDRAIADYNEAVRLNPQDALAYNNRGIAYRAKGDLDRAIANYDEAIRLDPKDALAYNNRGIAYQAKGDFGRATADYDEAIQLDPRDALAHYNRGIAYKAEGDLDRAIADYDEAVRLNPKDALAYSYRGYAYQAKGDASSALADFSEAIRLDPKNTWAYKNRGIVYLYGGLLDKAQADFKQAAELAPKDVYSALWFDIAERRAGLPSNLPLAAKQFDMTMWPAPLVRLFLGEISFAATFAAADDKDATRSRRKVCDANLYGAEFAMLQSRKEEALELYRLAAGDCPNDFIEWTAANAALRELGVTPYLQ
jgi:tetratricopeptide (TPR) repeat protein